MLLFLCLFSIESVFKILENSLPSVLPPTSPSCWNKFESVTVSRGHKWTTSLLNTGKKKTLKWFQSSARWDLWQIFWRENMRVNKLLEEKQWLSQSKQREKAGCDIFLIPGRYLRVEIFTVSIAHCPHLHVFSAALRTSFSGGCWKLFWEAFGTAGNLKQKLAQTRENEG